jgi:hypothetical protein
LESPKDISNEFVVFGNFVDHSSKAGEAGVDHTLFIFEEELHTVLLQLSEECL